jgi:hypothetical protein
MVLAFCLKILLAHAFLDRVGSSEQINKYFYSIFSTFFVVDFKYLYQKRTKAPSRSQICFLEIGHNGLQKIGNVPRTVRYHQST